MTLSEEQIERLYQFTQQHYVEYYDLQAELVDHLANGIEKQSEDNPTVTFEQALQNEFKKFGVFGFMDVVEKRQSALRKKYNHLVWEHMKTYVKAPKIVLIVVGIFFLKAILSNFSFASELVLGLFGVLLLTFYGGLFFRRYQNQQKTKISGKKWLFEEVIFGFGSVAGYSYIVLQVALHAWDKTSNPYMIWGVSIGIVVMAVIEHIILFEIPKKSEEYLAQTYPEYSGS